jgi:hypothetical protein
MIIKKKKESLDKASYILEEVLLKRSFSSKNDIEVEKWVLWFQKQSAFDW